MQYVDNLNLTKNYCYYDRITNSLVIYSGVCSSSSSRTNDNSVTPLSVEDENNDLLYTTVKFKIYK